MHLSPESVILFLLLLFVYLTCYASARPNVEGEALIELVTALKDSSHRIDWDYNFVSPCFSWSHVTCRNGNVVSLSFANMGFAGSLSPSIAKLKYLSSLDLQHNNISGTLPDYLINMTNLHNLNLGHNNFKGSIPSSWAQLSELKNLDLSSNVQLSGNIPRELFLIPTFNFTATLLTCGHTYHEPCASSIPSVPRNRSKIQASLTVASISVFFVLLVGAIFGYQLHRAHKRKGDDVFVDVAGEDELKFSLGQIKRFSLREIQLATDNFSERNVIGQGGSGKVYSGTLMGEDGNKYTKVAVKRLTMHYNCPNNNNNNNNPWGVGGEDAFLREVQLISVAVHKNLLRLTGFCTTSTERILVYPFMQNLSLAYQLRELKPGEKGLDWATRKRIAFGAAHGLEYLHEHCNPKIIHRDLKAANILLNEDFEAVLGDFGLAKLVDAKLTHVTTQVRGTMGHIAPEYLSTGKSSDKTDVFGYGITLLELVTGQRAIDLSRLEEEEDVLLLDHIKKLLREKRLGDIVDKNLKDDYDVREVETILQVAMLCTQNSPEDRPKMTQVATMLEGVGLAEKWAEWEQIEELRDREFDTTTMMPHKFLWADDSIYDQEAMQLSRAR